MFILIYYEECLVCLIITALAIFAYYKWAFRYWKNRNLEFVEPTIPFGTARDIFSGRKYIGIHTKEIYNKLKSKGCDHGGAFLMIIPKYIPVHPKFIQNVIQKDFQYFTERGFYYNERDDPLSANLFALGGEKWRNLRTKLSPAFTAGKMKMSFDAIVRCANQMRDFIEPYCLNKQSIDAKEIMACFTIDVIGSCAFGLDCNSFTHPNAEFKKQGKQIFDFSSLLRIIKVVVSFNFPNLARFIGIRLFDKESTEFFIDVVKTAVKFRRENNVIRQDMLQLLLELQDNTKENGDEVFRKLTAQVFIFFAAGFETSSTALTYCFYELALNQSIQAKLRAEITNVLAKHHGKITYDSIMDMKYLSQVLDETLRKYPPLPFITRRCVKDYKIPGTNTVLEKDMEVVISILGIHHDADYYPEPEKFDPGRFSEENKRSILPFTYFPFGEGPRICIGSRFGLLQMKVCLAILVKNFVFSVNEKTTVPVEYQVFSFTLVPKTGVLLDVRKANEN